MNITVMQLKNKNNNNTTTKEIKDSIVEEDYGDVNRN